MPVPALLRTFSKPISSPSEQPSVGSPESCCFPRRKRRSQRDTQYRKGHPISGAPSFLGRHWATAGLLF
jgi:hypothetical protein